MNPQFIEEILGFLPLRAQIPLLGRLGLPLRGNWVFGLPGGFVGWEVGGYRYEFHKYDFQFKDGYYMEFQSMNQWETGSVLFWPGGDEIRTWFEYLSGNVYFKKSHPQVPAGDFEKNALEFFDMPVPCLREWVGIVQHKISLGYTTPPDNRN